MGSNMAMAYINNMRAQARQACAEMIVVGRGENKALLFDGIEHKSIFIEPEDAELYYKLNNKSEIMQFFRKVWNEYVAPNTYPWRQCSVGEWEYRYVGKLGRNLIKIKDVSNTIMLSWVVNGQVHKSRYGNAVEWRGRNEEAKSIQEHYERYMQARLPDDVEEVLDGSPGGKKSMFGWFLKRGGKVARRKQNV